MQGGYHHNHNHNHDYDVIIIGAGASGLFCALNAAQRGRKVLLLDHANKAGKKILMSGGGRCNFTNQLVEARHFISANPHFCKSALRRYPSAEFIAMVERHGIGYHEREYGQLFCDVSAKDILTMLLDECQQAGVHSQLNTRVDTITALPCKLSAATAFEKTEAKTAGFDLQLLSKQGSRQHLSCDSLVVATGGLSIPTMGATGFGYQVAGQFGHEIVPTCAGLVPFTFTDALGDWMHSLAGISLDVVAFNDRISFTRPLLFTHRGLSGPAMLQLSNYWQLGEAIHINLLPNVDAHELLRQAKRNHGTHKLRRVLAPYFVKKLLTALEQLLWAEVADTELANIKDDRLAQLGQMLNDWTIKPSGTEGYRTAEVTRGGVATDKVSSKTFESQLQPGLYFIGEVLDVTGWLGGYNFQWAWASGYACGQVV